MWNKQRKTNIKTCGTAKSWTRGWQCDMRTCYRWSRTTARNERTNLFKLNTICLSYITTERRLIKACEIWCSKTFCLGFYCVINSCMDVWSLTCLLVSDMCCKFYRGKKRYYIEKRACTKRLYMKLYSQSLRYSESKKTIKLLVLLADIWV